MGDREKTHQKLHYYAPSPLINHGDVKCKTQMLQYFNPFLFQKPTNEKSTEIIRKHSVKYMEVKCAAATAAAGCDSNGGDGGVKWCHCAQRWNKYLLP